MDCPITGLLQRLSGPNHRQERNHRYDTLRIVVNKQYEPLRKGACGGSFPWTCAGELV